MRLKTAILTLLTIALFLPNTANAQRERRRQIVEGLLEGLIESQLEKLTENHNDHNHSGHNARPVRTRPMSPEMQAAQDELQHISRSMRNMVNVLQSESYTSPAYRQPLAEAMHIKAAVDGLYHNAPTLPDMRTMAQAWGQIDQAWRPLAHQLKHARGVNRSVLAIVDEVNQHTTEMCAMMGLGPQLDRTALVRIASQLNTELSQLLDDVSWELRGDRQQAHYIEHGRELLTQVRQATAWIDRGNYDSLVQAWKQGQEGWRSYADELRRTGNNRIRRGVMRVEQTGREMTKALLLPVPMDKSYLNHMVSSVNEDVDHILESVTMKDLIACPHPDELLRLGAELQSSCGSFSQAINTSNSLDDLVWDFQIFDVAWNDMSHRLASFENPEVQRHLRAGAQTMGLLNQSLGSGPQLSRNQLIQMAAELGDLSNRTTLFVNQQVMPSRIDYRVKNNILQKTIDLQSSVRSLHNRMIAKQPDNVISQELTKSINHWKQLKPLISQTPESAQQSFRQLRGEIEPLMVKLQVVYSR